MRSVPTPPRPPHRVSQPRWRWETPILVTGLILAIASGVMAYRVGGPYGERFQDDARVQRVFNETTGALELLIYDIDGDLRFDSWSYMQGERVLRTEYDDDGDGRVDHWEYFRPDGTTERLDADGDGDGRPDRRTLFDADGTPTSDTPLDSHTHTTEEKEPS